jgi:hypothetical protein
MIILLLYYNYTLQLGLLEASRRLNALNDLTSDPSSLGSAEVNNYTAILEELFLYTLMDIEVGFK